MSYAECLLTFVIDVKSGIVLLEIIQCDDLPRGDRQNVPNPRADAYTMAYSGNRRRACQTATYASSTHPIWFSEAKFICLDISTTIVSIEVVDRPGHDAPRKRGRWRFNRHENVIAWMSIPLVDLLERSMRDEECLGSVDNTTNARTGNGLFWWPLMGTKKGRIRMKATWRPVALSTGSKAGQVG